MHFRRKLSFVAITRFLGGTFCSNLVEGGTKTFYTTGLEGFAHSSMISHTQMSLKTYPYHSQDTGEGGWGSRGEGGRGGWWRGGDRCWRGGEGGRRRE